MDYMYRVEVWYEDPHLSPEDRAARHVRAPSMVEAVEAISAEMRVSLPVGKEFRVTSVVECAD